MTKHDWFFFEFEPLHSAGEYMVANSLTKEVFIAKWKPKLKTWTFASAAKAFQVTHWAGKPEAP